MDEHHDTTDEAREAWTKAIHQTIMELWLKDKISSGVNAEGDIVFWMTKEQSDDFEKNGVN